MKLLAILATTQAAVVRPPLDGTSRASQLTTRPQLMVDPGTGHCVIVGDHTPCLAPEPLPVHLCADSPIWRRCRGTVYQSAAIHPEVRLVGRSPTSPKSTISYRTQQPSTGQRIQEQVGRPAPCSGWTQNQPPRQVRQLVARDRCLGAYHGHFYRECYRGGGAAQEGQVWT